MRPRPALLGMNNPISSDQRLALWPAPEGCTGWRIWKMLNERTGATRSQYTKRFLRLNACSDRVWSRPSRERVAELLTQLRGHEVVVFGESVRRALGIPKELMLPHRDEVHDITWRQLPHPSGRCLWYNDDLNSALASKLLADLYNGE